MNYTPVYVDRGIVEYCRYNDIPLEQYCKSIEPALQNPDQCAYVTFNPQKREHIEALNAGAIYINGQNSESVAFRRALGIDEPEYEEDVRPNIPGFMKALAAEGFEIVTKGGPVTNPTMRALMAGGVEYSTNPYDDKGRGKIRNQPMTSRDHKLALAQAILNS